MSKTNSGENLELFNLIVSQLNGLDQEEQVHILSSVVNWLQLQQFFNSSSGKVSGAGVTSLHPQTQNSVEVPEQYELSPKEFMIEKDPQTNVERVACLAFYATHFRGTPHFKTLDLSKLNTEAAQPKFSNASMTVNDAAKAGLLVSAGKGNKQLSAIGEQYVLALPDKENAKQVLSSRRKPRKKITKSKK